MASTQPLIRVSPATKSTVHCIAISTCGDVERLRLENATGGTQNMSGTPRLNNVLSKRPLSHDPAADIPYHSTARRLTGFTKSTTPV